MAPWVTIRCVHGDEHRYPVVSVKIHFKGQKHNIKAVVSTCLSHPLILCTDWPGFHQVVKDLMGVRSLQLGRCEVCAADPMGDGFPPMEAFQLEQSRDDTLRFAFDQVRSVDGHLEMVFQVAYYNPMAGHLGSDKTLKRIMDRF